MASAENLMTNHVAKVEERVQVLETTVEQELQSPGMVSGAMAELAQLKVELGSMRQLMDEHPLQVAQRLQVLEKKVTEVADMQATVSNNLIPVLRLEMQRVAATMAEHVERRLQASEGRVLQAVGTEIMRLRVEMESALTTVANHVANTAQRQRILEENMAVQMAAIVSHLQGVQMPTPNTINANAVSPGGARSGASPDSQQG